MTNDERRELARHAEWMHGYQSQTAVELQRACDEIDALAAHVERLSNAAYEVCNDSFSYGGTSRAVNVAGDLATGDRGKYPCSMTALAEAATSSPTTSLARLKAQWAAEGAAAAAESIRMDYEGRIHADDIADFADEVADDYRRQAEEESE